MDINILHDDTCKGDRKAEEQLFRCLSERYRMFVGQSIRDRHDAEDVVQSTMAVIFSKYKEVKFEHSFAAWAHGVLNFEIMKYYRRKANHNVIFSPPADDEKGVPTINPNPVLRRRLFACLEQLCRVNKRYASVLSMKYQGLDTESICRALDIRPNNFYVLLSRSRAALKSCLKKEDIE